MGVECMNGSIRAGAFRNMNLSGRIDRYIWNNRYIGGVCTGWHVNIWDFNACRNLPYGKRGL